MRRHWSAFAAALALAGTVGAESPAHRVRHVSVASGVQLEVLDWGGTGPAMVFLAGFGNTAHVFDEFAPQFTTQYHVLAVARRNFGTSTDIDRGFDTRTLTDDIISVLDTLGVRRATLVGHSFGGSELSYLGANHADRVARLIYLDASYDFARLYADSVWQHAFPIPRPDPPATSDVAHLRQWLALVVGPNLPDDEIRAMQSESVSTAIISSFEHGAAPVDPGAIKAPVLALWAMPRSASDQYPYYASVDATKRARLDASFAAQRSVRRAHAKEFETRVPHVRFVMVSGGRHYLFLSHPKQVADAMRTFLSAESAR